MAAMTDAFRLMADKHVGEKDDDAGAAFAKRVERRWGILSAKKGTWLSASQVLDLTEPLQDRRVIVDEAVELLGDARVTEYVVLYESLTKLATKLRTSKEKLDRIKNYDWRAELSRVSSEELVEDNKIQRRRLEASEKGEVTFSGHDSTHVDIRLSSPPPFQ